MNGLVPPTPNARAKMVVEFVPGPGGGIEWTATLHSDEKSEILTSGIEHDIRTAIAKFHMRAIRGLYRD